MNKMHNWMLHHYTDWNDKGIPFLKKTSTAKKTTNKKTNKKPTNKQTNNKPQVVLWIRFFMINIWYYYKNCEAISTCTETSN